MAGASIANFRHRVTICSADDIVTADGQIAIVKRKAWDAWAKIEPKRGSTFSRDGQVIKESRDNPSHEISIRYRSDKVIAASAWIFEQRMRSEPRWFKIIKVGDDGDVGYLWCFQCRLVEKSDMIQRPQEARPADPASIVSPLPQGVVL